MRDPRPNYAPSTVPTGSWLPTLRRLLTISIRNEQTPFRSKRPIRSLNVVLRKLEWKLKWLFAVETFIFHWDSGASSWASPRWSPNRWQVLPSRWAFQYDGSGSTPGSGRAASISYWDSLLYTRLDWPLWIPRSSGRSGRGSDNPGMPDNALITLSPHIGFIQGLRGNIERAQKARLAAARPAWQLDNTSLIRTTIY